MMLHDAFRKPVGDKTGARPLTFIAFFLALLVACLWGAKAHAHQAYDCGRSPAKNADNADTMYIRMANQEVPPC